MVRLTGAYRSGQMPVTHGGVLGQVWRDGPRQSRLSRALSGIEVRPVDEALGRAAGEPMARTGTADVVDAAVALLAHDGDEVVTSDPHDLALLLAATGQHVEVITASRGRPS